MDWADDVAYSVHDVEDGIHAGHIDLNALGDPDVRATLAALAAGQYAPGADPANLVAALDRLTAEPFWPRAYAGSLRDLAALKDMTSQLIGRFTAAAEAATRAAHPQGSLTRHRGSLEGPSEVRMEVAVLKGVALMFVMQRAGSRRSYTRQQSLIRELVETLVRSAPAGLEPHLVPFWEQAPDDASRLRVVIDQVASLTDHSVVSWHNRHCR